MNNKIDFLFIDGSRIKNLTNMQFSDLKVKSFIHIKNKYALWLCECSCGNTIEVTSKDLLQKRKLNCGCIKNPYLLRGRRDLSGRIFDYLEVISLLPESGKKQKYRCKCLLCGKMKNVTEDNLISGNTKSCGCLVKANIKDMVFGELKAVRKTDESKNNSIVWEFECSCGNTCYFSVNDIMRGRRSCGCYREIMEEKHTHLHIIRDPDKMNIKNTSGYKGVGKTSNGKWGAKITFSKKSYWLGTYNNIVDAIKIRKIAEEKLHGDFLEWYKNNYINTEGSDNKI